MIPIAPTSLAAAALAAIPTRPSAESRAALEYRDYSQVIQGGPLARALHIANQVHSRVR